MSNDLTPAAPPAPGERLTTTINVRKWLIKMIVFAVAFTVLGIWGYIDATIVYPARGREHVEYMRYAYLKKLSETGQLLADRVDDPAAIYADLAAKGEASLSDLERLRLEWLRSLSRLHNLAALTEENRAELRNRQQPGAAPRDTKTLFADPAQTLAALQTKLATRSQPTPLSAYDIPIQWIFVVGGFGVGIYVVILIVAVSRRKFHYVPAEHRLILPDGREIVPADVKEVDKRKWHKYYSSFILNDGSVVELDLLRHVPLEEWFLEMEKLTPNYVPPPPEPNEDDGEPTPEQPAPAEAGEARA